MPPRHASLISREPSERALNDGCNKPLGNLKTNPTGPLMPPNFPDPRVIEVDGVYYAFSTNHPVDNVHVNVPVARSSSFTRGWHQLDIKNVLPDAGKWTYSDSSGNPHVWSPSVTQIDDKNFVMYHSAWNSSDQKHCMGAATATTITGPYTPQPTPFICPPQGAIDGQGFEHNSKRYLVHKIGGHFDSNGIAHIVIQPVDQTGTKKLDVAATQLVQTLGDEYDVEGPAMTLAPDGETVFLWYVTGYYQDTDYAIRYSTSTSPFGPFTNHDPPYLFQTDEYNDVYLLAPGGPSFVNDTHMTFMADHPHKTCKVSPNGILDRQIHAAVLTYDGHQVSVKPA